VGYLQVWIVLHLSQPLNDSTTIPLISTMLIRPSHPDMGQKELTAFCRDNLAAYQAPKRWRFVDQLPRNAMGKLNKKELLREYIASGAADEK
jgi:acyl-CoA synthetase (AMP-forming)/AMP-acid ligase II